MKLDNKINYVEFPASNIEATKAFFHALFAWQFDDFGPDYTAFSDEGIDGGFYRSDKQARQQDGSALVVFYSQDLEDCLQRVESAGGQVIKPIFSFPGGRRFHFTEPSGNEFAVWSDR